ncbi:MAG: uroporphyrinogen decarboxylase family protein [Desulfobacterales bacterium]|jgi:uroporphyrinogen-III decarboxylase|nr:uroporphyrinogen decarboxylase family protein [Desulfobacterales bacterium]
MTTRILSNEEKKERIAKSWQLQDVDEVPFLIEIGGIHMATTTYFSDHAAEIDWNEDFHKQREGVYDYGMPNIKPNQGINIVASAFGCEYTVNDEADPWIKPLIRDDNVPDVHALKVPDPKTNLVFKQAWDRIDYLQSHSNLPLRLVNVPSPLVTASLIWEYTSFVTATMLHPREVHVLLEKVTEATIGYLKEQLARIRNLHGMSHEMWHIPREVGVRISDDTASILSPKLYREFGVKYNSMISRAIGGLVVHSCGQVKNVVEPMMEIEGLRGLDFTIPQTDWEAVRKAAAGKTVLCLRHYYWDHGPGAQVDLAAYSQKLLDFFGRKGLFIQTSTPTAEEARTLGDKLHRILSR